VSTPTDPAQVFREAWRAAGLEPEIVHFDEPVPTAAVAAERLGCEVGAIANSLVFDADGEPVLVLASGAHRVDTGKVAADLGLARLRRASPDFVLEHTGQVVGGVGPTGHPHPLRTVIDADLTAYDRLWAGAGDKHSMVATTVRELELLTGGVVQPVC
jgi:prolyl-tRNA editing enzyme YbaK/EbsC (Cys-tRNA(Pro) deacylase)